VRLEIELFGATFQNPVLLAAGTCGFGQEPADVVSLVQDHRELDRWGARHGVTDWASLVSASGGAR
jgi:hypothetical protein